MGDHNVSTEHDSRQAQAFMRSLLADVSALERMIEAGRIESGVRRIGAEQEMFLIDRAMRPAPVAMEVLKNANDHRLTTEIGKFNLEANLSPRPLSGHGLREMEAELSELVAIARRAARRCDAFFYGLMTALPDEYGEIEKLMTFDDAKNNFFAAARHGLKAQLTWAGGRDYPASTLMLEHLLPAAREGLRRAGVDVEDRDRYLDLIQERVERDRTGAQWSLRSLAAMGARGAREARHRALTEGMLEQQESGEPVSRWELARLGGAGDWSRGCQTVAQLMSADLFTAHPDDLVDLAASVMEWRHIRYVPVEDDEGRLVGLISHRALLRLLAQGLLSRSAKEVTVKEIMTRDLITVAPETPALEALATMRRRKVGCLPVVENGRLVGIITAYDFLALSAEIIENQLGELSVNGEE